MLTVANTNEYGNGAKIAPLGNTTNGTLDLCIIKPFPIIVFTNFIDSAVFAGTIHKSRYVIYKTNTSYIVESENSFCSHVDGEPFLVEKKADDKY